MRRTAGRTALVVDDDPDIRFMARRQLEAVGYATLEAGDGREALELLLHGSRPEVVLLDLRMPGVDGVEVIEELRAHRLLQEIPVIVTSAHVTGDVLDELIHLGCRAALKKPYTQDQLVEGLRRATE